MLFVCVCVYILVYTFPGNLSGLFTRTHTHTYNIHACMHAYTGAGMLSERELNPTLLFQSVSEILGSLIKYEHSWPFRKYRCMYACMYVCILKFWAV